MILITDTLLCQNETLVTYHARDRGNFIRKLNFLVGSDGHCSCPLWYCAKDGVHYAVPLSPVLECRYHVIGSHGGAWIYDVTSNEELDRLLAVSPVYNYASYQVLALAEMEDPRTVMGKGD